MTSESTARPGARATGPRPSGRRRSGHAGRTTVEATGPARDLGPPADPESVARTILLDQLTGRARSRHELSEKLAARQVPGDVAARVLDRFEEVGLVDDAAFARAWVAGRQSAKGLARRALAQELRRKGIEEEVAREALDDLDPALEDEAARGLVRKKLRTLRTVDRSTATRRLVAMLARKGYPPGTAYAVVRTELDRDRLETSEAGPTDHDDDGVWP